MMEEHPDRAHYRLIADQIRHRIISERLAAGTNLPSESQLREEFGVSGATIRRALQTCCARRVANCLA